jgi:hypothetical protein
VADESNQSPERTSIPAFERSKRERALESAKANNALSGFFADQDTLALIARHVRGEITMPELVDGVRQVVAKITATGSATDHRHQVEANFTTMRLYELVIDPV